MRLHRILLSVPICALYTEWKTDTTGYRSVSTETILTVHLTFTSAFIIALMLPTRFWKPLEKSKAFLFFDLFFAILWLLCLHGNRLFFFFFLLRTKPQPIFISSGEFHKTVCQEIMTAFNLDFLKLTRKNQSPLPRETNQEWRSNLVTVSGQMDKGFTGDNSYWCPYFRHNGQWDPLPLWSVLETLPCALGPGADSDYKTCAKNFSLTFCCLEYTFRVGCM